MPVFEVTSPDGKTFEITAPDGATQEQVLAYAQSQFGTKQAARKTDVPNAIGTGANQGLLRLAGLPVDTVANVIDLGKAALGAPYTALTGKPAPAMLQVRDRADVVGSGENLIRSAPQQAVRAQNPEYEGGYLQTAGAALPTMFAPSSGRQALAQTATSLAGALAAKRVGDDTGSVPLAVVAGMLPGALNRPRVQVAPTQKEKTIQAARQQGYVLPPSHTGAGWVNNRLESIAGKAALDQDATHRNQAVTNRIALRSTGIPEDLPVTHDALAQLRLEAGRRGYAPLEQVGTVPITRQYADRILEIENQYGNAGSPLSSLRYPRVNEMATELLPASFTGPELNALIKSLRESGSKTAGAAYGSDQGTQALGKAQIAGAKALENLIDEHLLQYGPSNIVPNLRAARKEIAQLHTLEQALNTATGDVNAHTFGQRIAAGKPVSPDQRLIGQFALAEPKVSKPAAGTPTPGVSALEAAGVPAAALAGAMSTGNAHGVLAGGLPLLRAPVRNMLLSKWYQDKFAKRAPKRGGLTPEQQGALSQMLLTAGVLDQPD